jgi:hypothetical protein
MEKQREILECEDEACCRVKRSSTKRNIEFRVWILNFYVAKNGGGEILNMDFR